MARVDACAAELSVTPLSQISFNTPTHTNSFPMASNSAPKQSVKSTLNKTVSFALDTIDSARFFDATLAGDSLRAIAHTVLTQINSNLLGDTLTARGNASTLIGGAGRDSLVALGSNSVLVAGKGTDTLVAKGASALFSLAGAAQLSTDSLAGSAGNNTLVIASASKLSDSSFARVKGVQTVSLAGASSATLGAAAKSAGVSALLGGNGKGTLVQGTDYAGGATLAGGSDKDLISVATRLSAVADSVSGGAGIDTLQVLQDVTLSDASFARISGIEVLSLGIGSAVTLGSQAMGTGTTLVSATSIVQTEADTLAVRMVGNAAANSFSVGNVARLAADSIQGGTGTDTLAVTNQNGLTDASFTNVKGVEVLSLGGAGTVTIDKLALKAGISSLLGGTGSLSLTVGKSFTKPLTVTGGSQGDSLALDSAKQLATVSLDGGQGIDTLSVGSAGVLSSSLLGNVSNVEVLSLTGASSVTVDSVILAKGISTIYGGTGNSTFNVVAGSETVIAGAGTSNLFTTYSEAQLATGSLVGSSGIDTLRLLAASSFTDGALSRTSGIEVLSLSGKSNLSAGTGAAAKGLRTIQGSQDNSLYTLSAAGFSLSAGSGDDVVVLSDASLMGTGGDTVAAGKGRDTLSVLGSGSLADSGFKNVSGFEEFSASLTGLTLGENALAEGIRSVTLFGSTGTATLVQDQAFTAPFALLGRDGNDLVVVDSGKALSAQTLDGGKGNDTLSIASPSKFADQAFANVQNFGTLKLSEDGGSKADLGSLAAGANIGTVLLSGGGDTVAASRYSGGADVLVLDASASDGANWLEGSSSTPNLFRISDATGLGTTTIRGGFSADGDTLAVGEDDLTDASFANVRIDSSVNCPLKNNNLASDIKIPDNAVL